MQPPVSNFPCARISDPETQMSPLPETMPRDKNTHQLSRLPLRHSSSPLRPSQWATRGGLLSPPRVQIRTPDRFIPSRRPPNTARESFELNKPTDRLIGQEKITRGGAASADPFSRWLPRSGRLSDELRSLRETHSVIIGRANFNRRGANHSLRRSSFPIGTRQVSAGAVWNVGGSSAVSDTVVGVSNGRGGMLGSRTNAPLYTSMFLSRSDPEAELEAYERRLALAFDVDQTDRVLGHATLPSSPASTSSTGTGSQSGSPSARTKHVWRDNAWTRDGSTMLLDAPHLRDDYYCSLLAYSHTAKCLAVGLGNFVHLWSERKGVDTPESLNTLSTAPASDVQHVTSLSFSSVQGCQAILAVGRADGRIALWSPFDSEPRFDAVQPKPISCVSFRPTVVRRPSLRDRAMTVPTEELLIGDEAGHIYFYSVEWPNETDSALFSWHGAMTLLARMTMHRQQICGLSWSVDGELFASGGNDNACFLFETRKVLQGQPGNDPSATLDVRHGTNGESIWTVTPGRGPVLSLELGREKHKWELNAAVKAIAFCPWQRGLLAIGGGSNDRCIHFYHTVSGACLATIDCAAQVTSLIWSTTRREIAATFGFAQPEHPFRIAVFAWPSCEQIVAIPWYDENRALYAIPYPGGPNTGREKGEDGVWWSRTSEEGCIVAAASDAAIRFHEIWTEDKRNATEGAGLLGGSDILENLHGIEKDGDPVIR
ncbi:WD40 repeat-like protein [Zopfia rhizophila CBS 207.26]|uniref:WD40 repeat-like protein n=1 Tax=Zopfia rhizophila CBS 207.26 TaxID=1314779 RepID=A0A6A6EI94_9PEZI|nr:WD40 repeat-like protein [Zopfia rhizophila CBS 207.26]